MIDDETFLSIQITELEARIARLLAVAKAAKELKSARPDSFDKIDKARELAAALAAVEDLL